MSSSRSSRSSPALFRPAPRPRRSRGSCSPSRRTAPRSASPPPISRWACGRRCRRRPRARGRSCSPAGCWRSSPARSPTTRCRSRLREAEHDVEIRSGGSSFHLRVLPAEDFPKFPDEDDEPLTIPAAALAETVEVVARAASRDDMRPVLTGVLVSAAGAEMTMVATDSYRLAVKRTELEPALSGELEANIPARALRELGRIVSADEVGEVAVSLLPNQAVFKAGAIVLNTRLIDGPIPQLSTTPAGVLRPRRAPAAGRVPRGRPPRQPARPAQRSAAARPSSRAS